MLGLLFASYEMNAFKDSYQKAVIENAKFLAKSLAAEGLGVAGDPALGYTQTHQVIVNVGYAHAPQVADRLEENHIFVNYQATPIEEGFTASGALRLGVSEMTRLGFEKEHFQKLASLMSSCILKNTKVVDEVIKLRKSVSAMKYTFDISESDLNDFVASLI
jgi:aminomethyltransferase